MKSFFNTKHLHFVQKARIVISVDAVYLTDQIGSFFLMANCFLDRCVFQNVYGQLKKMYLKESGACFDIYTKALVVPETLAENFKKHILLTIFVVPHFCNVYGEV